MGLIRLLFWTVVFVASTFAFTVLFEYGPTNYSANAQKEFASLKKLYSKKIEHKEDSTDKLTK